jgi:NTP pyrophosphatase (non-canonical NTP hydrolase)
MNKDLYLPATWGQCANFGNLRDLVYQTRFEGVTAAMLCSGLVEETVELLEKPKTISNPFAGHAYNQKEIGDNLWYIIAFEDFLREGNRSVVPRSDWTLDSYQAFYKTPRLHLQDLCGETIAPDNYEARIAVSALRVVDSVRPKNDRLWLGVDRRQQRDLGLALSDHLIALGIYASSNGIRFSQGARELAGKLSARQRKPHVVEDVVETSGRERLMVVVPLVGQLLHYAGFQKPELVLRSQRTAM